MTSLRISELAAQTGVPPTTLRYYEQVGLLTAGRTSSGYRVYDQRAVEWLRFISAAKRMQLSLDAIRELLQTWQDQPCRTVKARLRPVVSARLAEAEVAVDALNVLAAQLRSELDHLDALPDREHGCDPSCAFLDTAPSEANASEQSDSYIAGSDELPLACLLAGDDHAARLGHWHTLLTTAPLTRNARGITAVLPADRAGPAADLIVAEQGCCPFLNFTLTFIGNIIELTVTAPNESALPFLDALVPDAAR